MVYCTRFIVHVCVRYTRDTQIWICRCYENYLTLTNLSLLPSSKRWKWRKHNIDKFMLDRLLFQGNYGKFSEQDVDDYVVRLEWSLTNWWSRVTSNNHRLFSQLPFLYLANAKFRNSTSVSSNTNISYLVSLTFLLHMLRAIYLLNDFLNIALWSPNKLIWICCFWFLS